MGTLSGFAYAQARIQALLAALPGEQEWDRLAGSRTLSGFIEEARTGPMRPWIKGFSALSEPHAIERGLRALFRDLVDELAGWVPERWGEAVRWVAWLPVLPALGRVAGGGRMPAWIERTTSCTGCSASPGSRTWMRSRPRASPTSQASRERTGWPSAGSGSGAGAAPRPDAGAAATSMRS